MTSAIAQLCTKLLHSLLHSFLSKLAQGNTETEGRSASQCTWDKGEAWLREQLFRLSSVTVSGVFLGLIVQFKRIIDQTSLFSQACCKAQAPTSRGRSRKAVSLFGKSVLQILWSEQSTEPALPEACGEWGRKSQANFPLDWFQSLLGCEVKSLLLALGKARVQSSK